ncbi:MAG TPA: hypothetical protein VGD10_06530 [Allosphingosinicella sp.]|uniref:hypothetical protein n=1 Tax=Allosphingosinicella sp. TaxID=2823234 RepID=UPI002ED9CC86
MQLKAAIGIEGAELNQIAPAEFAGSPWGAPRPRKRLRSAFGRELPFVAFSGLGAGGSLK